MGKSISLLFIGATFGVLFGIILNPIVDLLFDSPEIKYNHFGEISELHKGSIVLNSNDGVLINFEYARPVVTNKRDSLRSESNVKQSLMNFARSGDAIYFYDLELPYNFNNGVIVTKVDIEARVLEIIKERKAKQKEEILTITNNFKLFYNGNEIPLNTKEITINDKGKINFIGEIPEKFGK